MDKTTLNLYRAITSENYSEANELLGKILEAKTGVRINDLLKSTEEN